MSALLIILIVLAVLAVGLLAVGNVLVDFALNPRAKHSIVSRIAAGDADGLDPGVITGDPLRAEALRWFEAAKQDISLSCGRDGILHGWAFPAEGVRVGTDGRLLARDAAPGGRYGILCHGYAGKPADVCIEAYLAHQQGVTVITPAARGFERNDDRLIGMGYLDAHDLLGWIGLITQADADARIALYGVSMGGAEVMMAAGEGLPANVRCIIEDCGYTSVWDEFAYQMRSMLHLPVHPLLDAAALMCRLRAGYGFRSASAVRSLARARVPMLFIHGTADTFVPYRMLDEVYAACANPVKERVAIEGAGHALASHTDRDRYYGAIGLFLQRFL